jgi:hypothetical protein
MRSRFLFIILIIPFVLFSCNSNQSNTQSSSSTGAPDITSSSNLDRTSIPPTSTIPPTMVFPTLSPTDTSQPSPTPTLKQPTTTSVQKTVSLTATPKVKPNPLNELSDRMELEYKSLGFLPSDDLMVFLSEKGYLLNEQQIQEYNELMINDPLFQGGKSIDFNNSFGLVDLYQDDQPEWVISLLSGDSGVCILPGELWVVNESGRAVRMALDPDWGEWGAPMPFPREATDMTGDGKPDMVVQTLGCLIHTSLGLYHVLSAQSGKIENIVKVDPGLERAAIYRPTTYETAGSGISVPSPQFQIANANKDKLPDLLVTAGSFGSEGAGETLLRQEIWSWAGDGLRLSDIKFADTPYRHLKLYQANFRYNQGRYKDAISLYETVVKGKNTSDVVEPVDEIRLFAAFRLAMSYLLQDKASQAKEWVKWMENEYPDAPLTKAGRLLIDQAKNAKQVPEACKPVTAFLNKAVNPLGVLSDPFAVGYGNPTIYPDDVCYVNG